jgi:hypothetical protein
MTNRQKFFVIASVLFSGAGLWVIFVSVTAKSLEQRLDASVVGCLLFALAILSVFADPWLRKIGAK